MMAYIQYTMQIIMSFPYDIHGFYNVAQGFCFRQKNLRGFG